MSNKKTFLALGDSYTVGEMVETSHRWTMQLVQKFNEQNISFATPVTIAHTGWTTGELLTAIHQLKLNGKFDLVSLLIGVNNQYRGYAVEDYRKEFLELLQLAIEYADHKKNKVVVVAIPDWSFTPFGEKDQRGAAQISHEIDIFNSINKMEALKVGVHYADISLLSKNHDLSLLTTDQLHPSGKQYGLWAEKIYNEIKKEFL